MLGRLKGLLMWTVLMAAADDKGGGGGAPAASGGAPAGGDKGGGDAAAAAAAAAGGGDKGGTPAGGDEGDKKGYWPDDWVSRVSGGDEKLAKRFSRYQSPEAVAKALVAAQNRLDSGEFIPALPKDAKPDEVAAWRKQMGIPDKPEGYELKFDSGLVIGKEDKQIIDGFLKAAHDANLQPGQVKGAIEWYYQEQERQTEARVMKDDEERVACLDELNGEWGKGFRPQMNAIGGVLNLFPESVREDLKGARLPDGRGVFNHPDVLRAFAMIAKELNPTGVLAPGSVGDMAKSVEARLKEISDYRAKHRAAYNKDEAMQAEERQLLEAQEKMKARQAA